MRKTFSVIIVVCVAMASILCCCSQASVLGSEKSSCCPQTGSTKASQAHIQSSHSCDCQHLLGAISGESLKSQKLTLASIFYNVGLSIDNPALITVSSAASIDKHYYPFSSPASLYVKNSVLRV